MRKYAKYLAAVLVFMVLGIYSCNWEPFNPEQPDQNTILTHWIWDTMNDVYLWADYLPNLNPDNQDNKDDPEAYFYDLLYEKDRFSRIFKDADVLMAAIEGKETTTGISAHPFISEGSKVISIVEFVTPGTPAADSGIQRGEIIYAIDGTELDTSNYYSLYYQETVTLDFADWNGTDFIPNGREIELTAVEQDLDPVVYHEVIDFEGRKIGYMVYTQFTDGPSEMWINELDDIFSEFSAEGIEELVIDLRYNPGGLVSVCSHIASSIGPASMSGEGKVFYHTVWNEGYMDFWKDYDADGDGHPDGEDSPALVARFPEPVVNLDLSRVFFLTTGGTASASELLMTGLYPYMDVVQIGTTTVGKCFASTPIEDNNNPKRHNWAMLPLIYKYSNAGGFTDFVNGIDPDYEVKDNLLYGVPFGNFQDPLLAKALEVITGVNPSSKSAVRQPSNLRDMGRPLKAIGESLIILPNGI
jgi:carboxyl-terminal processing protease